MIENSINVSRQSSMSLGYLTALVNVSHRIRPDSQKSKQKGTLSMKTHSTLTSAHSSEFKLIQAISSDLKAKNNVLTVSTLNSQLSTHLTDVRGLIAA